MVSLSPELLSVSVPACPATFRFTLAVAVPMVTASALVGTPLFQLPAVPQLLSPEVPVHESAVRGGCAPYFAVSDEDARVAACALTSDCSESFFFDPACAEAKLSRLKRN